MTSLSLLLVFVLLVSGCIDNFVDQGQFNEGLAFQLSADPERVFTNDNVRLIMDLENKDIKPYRDVTVSVFDTGLLLQRCSDYHYDELAPTTMRTQEQAGLFASFFCCGWTPATITGSDVTTTVYGRVTYATSFSLVQLIEMVSEQYYEAHRGEIITKPRSYVYKDKNLEVAVDFSGDLPLLVRPGTQSFMRVQITNIGNGFVGPIRDLTIKPVNNEQLDIFRSCAFETLEPVNNAFPRKSCELLLPPGLDYLANYDAIVEFTYTYEVRDQTDVTIMRGY